MERVLPAMGYGSEQREDLRATIHRAAEDVDVIVIGTPMDLARVLDLEARSVQVSYDLDEMRGPTIADLLAPILQEE